MEGDMAIMPLIGGIGIFMLSVAVVVMVGAINDLRKEVCNLQRQIIRHYVGNAECPALARKGASRD